MLELFPAAADLAWPLVVGLAWLAGEFGHRWTTLPRISFYGLVGFACGHAQLGLLTPESGRAGMVMANVAFGLILFEFGYRINLRWMRTNLWLTATGLLEALATFGAVCLVSQSLGASTLTSLLLGSLSMSTSPAAVMRVINEQRSAGQVTERLLHLAALNCTLAVFAFKVIVGFWTFESSGSFWQAISSSVVVLATSAALGACFGIGVCALMRRTGRSREDSTVAFAIAVVLLVGITHTLKLSPLLAALTFGLWVRIRRVSFTQTQRNFGALGDLLTIVLFTYISTTLEWQRVASGLGLAAALVAVRLAVKVLCVTALAKASGTSWRKGALTGLALTPISAFVILLLEQTRYLGIDLLDQLAPLAAATLLLEIVGPVITQFALRAAGECHDPQERPRANGTL